MNLKKHLEKDKTWQQVKSKVVAGGVGLLLSRTDYLKKVGKDFYSEEKYRRYVEEYDRKKADENTMKEKPQVTL